mmetsp:Transcript_10853/g.17983  ORF Transcript_10853/g.17983 Transcript_10853/m.17983 type:complete len:237 (+) Transcript_10853:121-831(+)
MTKATTNIEEVDEIEGIMFVDYKDESQLESVMSLVGRDLSEPYSIFTYRYFLERFPQLCILACPAGKPDEPIGCVVGKIDYSSSPAAAANTATATGEQQQQQTAAEIAADNNHDEQQQQNAAPLDVPSSEEIIESTGYIGMLAVMASHRRLGIGTSLVTQVLKRMRFEKCASVTLETEVSNAAAQRLYQDTFGFIREELLVRYYLNWGDAYRLRLWFAANAAENSHGRNANAAITQ